MKLGEEIFDPNDAKTELGWVNFLNVFATLSSDGRTIVASGFNHWEELQPPPHIITSCLHAIICAYLNKLPDNQQLAAVEELKEGLNEIVKTI